MGLTFGELMGDTSGEMGEALAHAQRYVRETPRAELLGGVGTTIETLPQAHWPDKRWFQKSYGRATTDAPCPSTE